MKFKYKTLFVATFLSTRGLTAGALVGEIAKLEDVPEYQRGWYAADGAGKFKIDLTKVDAEDVGNLKASLETTRKERDTQKRIAEEKMKDFMKQYEGLDPVKMREILSKFSNEEEAALIAAGKLDQVIEKRTEKLRTEMQKQVDAEKASSKASLEKSAKYMNRVLDNEIRAAVTGMVHDSALKNGDVLRAAREIFSLDEEGKAIQLDKDGNVVMGKDAKTPFTPAEWIESMKATAPHWFPSNNSGGDSPGSRKVPGSADMSHLSPTQRITEARKRNAVKKS